MEKKQPLATVQMFWMGAPLSRLERLSLSSFVAHGHPVDLYVYEDVAGIPAGVSVKDAGSVLPRSAVFTHRRTGSVALFADWFRYRLLHEKGGLWADSDMVCLRPLRYSQPEVFAWQDDELICNALLGFSPGHALTGWLAQCCENPNRWLPYDNMRLKLRKWRRRVLSGNRRENVRWGENGPRGLTRAARYFGYAEKALPAAQLYPVHFTQWRRLFQSPAGALQLWMESSDAVHLWNNQIDTDPSFDKNGRFAADSPFEILCQRYLDVR